MGFVFAPLMWLIGIASVDIMPMGQLLGIKLSINEFIAYMQLLLMFDQRIVLKSFLAQILLIFVHLNVKFMKKR